MFNFIIWCLLFWWSIHYWILYRKKSLNTLKIFEAFVPNNAQTKSDPFIGSESCDLNLYSTWGKILIPFKISSQRQLFIYLILKLENEPPSYRLPMPILIRMPLLFFQDFHLDTRVSCKSFLLLIFIITWTHEVGGDSSINLFNPDIIIWSFP